MPEIDKKEKSLLVSQIFDKLVAVYPSTIPVNDQTKLYWWEVLSQFSINEINRAYKRFKLDYKGDFLPKPAQFMDFRFSKSKDIEEEIKKTKDLIKMSTESVPMPDYIKEKCDKLFKNMTSGDPTKRRPEDVK